MSARPASVAALLKPLEEQSGDDQHEERQRDLNPDESLTHPAARRSLGPGAKRVLRMHAGHQPGGHGGGQARGQDTQSRGKGEADDVDLGLKTDRQRAGDVARPQRLRGRFVDGGLVRDA